MTRILLPLYLHPAVDPAAWEAVATGGAGVTVVVDGPVDDPAVRAALARLAATRVNVIGRVDAGFAARPVSSLLEDVAAWARHPVGGVLLDQAPTSRFSLGAVALAARVARRAGLARVVLNPGIPPDPRYRDLGAAICTFHGPWQEYLRWAGDGARPGDGHLVHSVPATELAPAWALLRRRGAGFGLVTDRTLPDPYAGLPGWLSGCVPVGGGAGSGGRRMRSGW